MKEKGHILLVDDSEDDRFLWNATVKNFGYSVSEAVNGQQALTILQTLSPNVILLDVNMPVMNGHETCKKIRAIPKFNNTPVIMLTSSDELNDKLNSFEEGADEYITKEMEPLEIKQRIETVLKRYKKNLDSNPLTRLPGNNTILIEVQKRIDTAEKFSIGYCDLDNFKAYNDKYGFSKGDEIILFAARLIEQAVQNSGDQTGFTGHIGGDDFVYICEPQFSEPIAKIIINGMEDGIEPFYTEEDFKQGEIVSVNRRGEAERFPLVSISIAIVSNQNRKLTSMAEVSIIASEVKKAAKNKPGNSIVVDKRQDSAI